MNDGPVQVDHGPEKTPWFLPVAILSMALLLIAVALAEDSVAPVDRAGDPGPIVELEAELPSGHSPPAPIAPEADPAPRARVALRELVPGFDGTLHLWVRDSDRDQLLVWSDPLSEPRPMDLPDGVVRVDLNAERVKTLVVTENRNGNGVLWLGDRNDVEPAIIFDFGIDARWHSSRADQLAISGSAEDRTIVVVYRVEPGNHLVEIERHELEAGRAIEWVDDNGIAFRSVNQQPVAVWLTRDGTSTTFSRHLTQPGGRPIFDICTGVPCRPTSRMYVAVDGTFTVVPPEVVQVTLDESWHLVLTLEGPGVRRPAETSATEIPISGLNAWSSDGRWMAFEQEALIVDITGADGLVTGAVSHPLGILDLELDHLSSLRGLDKGRVLGIWLP